MEWFVFAIMAAIVSGIVPSIDKKILKNVSVLEFSVFFAIINAVLVLPILILTS